MSKQNEIAEIKEILNTPPEEVKPDVIKPEEDADTVVVEPEEEPTDDGPAEVEDAEPEQDAEESKTYTVSSLAEAIGWDTEDLYNDVMIPMKDGENVSLGDFKNKYQDVTHENEQLKTQVEEARKAQGGTEQSQQLSQQMITLAGNLDQINRVESGTDWAELEEIDATEAVLKRDKIRRARDEVEQAMQGLHEKETEAHSAYIGQQLLKMVDIIPDWKDDTVRDKDQGAIRANMVSYGFTDAEINTIIDPRQMQMMNDFTRLKEKAAVSLKAVKRVRTAPKVLNSNRNVSKGDPTDALNKLVNKATRSGDRKLEHQAIKGILEGKV